MRIESARESVALFTEQMIDALSTGEVAAGGHHGDPDVATRLAQLQAELAAVLNPS